MSVTKSIRDAIVTDLETIQTTNDYALTVKKVYPEPTGIEKRIFPFLELRPDEGGSSESTELGSRGGESAQIFSVLGGVASGAPMTDVMALFDDVRNAIEKPTSSILALSSPNVITATVADWQIGPTGEDVSPGLREFTADIAITYSYTRGSA